MRPLPATTVSLRHQLILVEVLSLSNHAPFLSPKTKKKKTYIKIASASRLVWNVRLIFFLYSFWPTIRGPCRALHTRVSCCCGQDHKKKRFVKTPPVCAVARVIYWPHFIGSRLACATNMYLSLGVCEPKLVAEIGYANSNYMCVVLRWF